MRLLFTRPTVLLVYGRTLKSSSQNIVGAQGQLLSHISTLETGQAGATGSLEAELKAETRRNLARVEAIMVGSFMFPGLSWCVCLCLLFYWNRLALFT